MIYIIKYKTWKVNVTTNPARNMTRAGGAGRGTMEF